MSSNSVLAVFLFFVLVAFNITQHAEAGIVCGGLGNYNISVTTFFMGNFFFKAQSTFALCADFCKSDSRCRSFRYSYYSDADAQYCEFFNLYAEDYFLPDNTQPYYYYDVDCPMPSFAVTEYSATTTTTTTSTLPESTITSRLTSTQVSTVSRTATTSLSFTVTRTSTRLATTTQVRYCDTNHDENGEKTLNRGS